jgi:hypothetical protein
MDEGKPISQFAQRFVERKLQQFANEAVEGAGLSVELFAQNFSDRVEALAARAKRPELREHIAAQAEKSGYGLGQERNVGRWVIDAEQHGVRWNGETPDALKQIDWAGQWIRKTADERARYVLGHFGEGSRTPEEYPGLQIEKLSVVGPVRWGPGQPGTEEALKYAEKMLDDHLGFAAPKLASSSLSEIRRSHELSGQIGAKVHTRAWKKYAKECAAPRASSAQKYAGLESFERELRPPTRSR